MRREERARALERVRAELNRADGHIGYVQDERARWAMHRLRQAIEELASLVAGDQDLQPAQPPAPSQRHPRAAPPGWHSA
jgi:uncharacterized membrane protein YccC